MKRFMGLNVLVAAAVLAGTKPACAQIQAIDDILVITKGQVRKEQARTHQHLDIAGAERAFSTSPGSAEARLGEPVLTPQPGFLTGTLSGLGQPYPATQRAQIAPSPRALPNFKAPLYGPLELPPPRELGPPEGLTLDAAIDRLVNSNYDLRVKFQEIPKADADILSAGLRLNPILFASADSVPYGSYSPLRPGADSYGVTVAQPIDINHKRVVRVQVATEAKRVLEAQYQNAVRLQIDNLYTAFVDVLEAQQAFRMMQTGLTGLDELVKKTRELVQKGQQPKTELDRVLIQQFNSENGVKTAEVSLAQAKRNLATLLAIPPQQADCLDVQGSTQVDLSKLPCAEDLIQLAIGARPDLTAYRLGVQRAQAGLQLARAERIEDVFLFYTPYTFTNNTPQGGQNANSWGAGLLLPLPVFNRNQGNIARAQANVAQTQIELEGLEREVANEVQRAAAELASSTAIVDRYQQDILPAAGRLRDEKHRLYSKGQESLISYLEAQREYNEIVRQYLESLVRHRRTMLRLNTAVGQRFLP